MGGCGKTLISITGGARGAEEVEDDIGGWWRLVCIFKCPSSSICCRLQAIIIIMRLRVVQLTSHLDLINLSRGVDRFDYYLIACPITITKADRYEGANKRMNYPSHQLEHPATGNVRLQEEKEDGREMKMSPVSHPIR